MKFLDEIFDQAAAEAPREMCGLIVERNNEEKYIPCANISTEENQFEIDGKDLGKYQLISKIEYIVHSHYMQDCHPSKLDKDSAKALQIPDLIVSYPDQGVELYDPR